MKNGLRKLIVLFLVCVPFNYVGMLSCSAAAAAASKTINKKNACTKCSRTFAHEGQYLRHVLTQHENVSREAISYSALNYAQSQGINLTVYGLPDYSAEKHKHESESQTDQAASAVEQDSSKMTLRPRKKLGNSGEKKRKHQQSESEDESASGSDSDASDSQTSDIEREDEDSGSEVQQSKKKRSKLQCNQCNRIFTDPGNLRRHVKVIHQGIKLAANQPVYCNLCNKPQSNPANLIRHQRTVHGIKPYECYVKNCAQAFNTYTKAESHIRKVHKEEPKRELLQLDHKAIHETQHDTLATAQEQPDKVKKTKDKPKGAAAALALGTLNKKAKKKQSEDDSDYEAESVSSSDDADEGANDGDSDFDLTPKKPKKSSRAERGALSGRVAHTVHGKKQDGEYACGIEGCLSTFGYERNVWEHWRKVHKLSHYYECPLLCAKSRFTHWGSYRKHIQSHSVSDQAKIPAIFKVKRFPGHPLLVSMLSNNVDENNGAASACAQEEQDSAALAVGTAAAQPAKSRKKPSKVKKQIPPDLFSEAMLAGSAAAVYAAQRAVQKDQTQDSPAAAAGAAPVNMADLMQSNAPAAFGAMPSHDIFRDAMLAGAAAALAKKRVDEPSNQAYLNALAQLRATVPAPAYPVAPTASATAASVELAANHVAVAQEYHQPTIEELTAQFEKKHEEYMALRDSLEAQGALLPDEQPEALKLEAMQFNDLSWMDELK